MTRARTAPPSGFCRYSGTVGLANPAGIAISIESAAAQIRESGTRIADILNVLLADKLDAAVQCVNIVLAEARRIHQLARLACPAPRRFDHSGDPGLLEIGGDRFGAGRRKLLVGFV